MKKIVFLIIAFLLFLCGCAESKNLSEERLPLPHVFVNGKYYYTSPDFSESSFSDGNFVPEGKLTFRNTSNLRELKEREGNFPECDGQLYGFSEGKLYVEIRFEENGSFTSHWVEMTPVTAMESTETSTQNRPNPYSSSVPERPLKTPSSDPSYVHSTDTSSNFSDKSASLNESQSGITTSSTPENTTSGSYVSQEETHYFKGRIVKKLPEYSDLPNVALGTEDILKRWYFTIADVSDISELRLQSDFADEMELSFEDSFSLIKTLRSISPGTKPKMENPATGGSFTVAAFDVNEKELWRASLDGYEIIISFGGENACYVFDMAGQNFDFIKFLGHLVSSSRP